MQSETMKQTLNIEIMANDIYVWLVLTNMEFVMYILLV